MNEQIKQRLVGAIVLISLAVIFIPMLLDGGEDPSKPRNGSNIPEQPEFNFEPLEIPLEPVEAPAEEPPRVIDEVEKPVVVASKPEEKKPQPEKIPLVKKKPLVEKKPVKPESAATTEAQSSKPATSEEPIRWVVQVGSFSESANALALRDKLRKNGFTAFVEKYADNGKTSYRVRVGPELKRETAERQLARLESKLKLKGIVMGHH